MKTLEKPADVPDTMRTSGLRNNSFSPSLRVLLVLCLAGLQAFAVLTVVFFITVGTERALVEQSTNVIQEVGARLTGEVRGFLDPARNAAELSARLVSNGALDASDDAAIESHLFRLLQIAPQQSGLYFARPDGTFVFVSRADETGVFRTKITQRTPRLARYIWRDESYSELRSSVDPSDTYDPRTRPWFTNAVQDRATVWTEPYTFFTSKRPGISTATPVLIDGELAGVFGVDIEISTLNSMLKTELGISDLISLILTDTGAFIAGSSAGLQYGGTNFQTLADLGDPIAEEAFGPRLDGTNGVQYAGPVLTSDGKVIIALAPFSDWDLPWQVGVYAPQKALIGEIDSERRKWMWIVLAVVGTSALIAFLLASRIGQVVDDFTRATGQAAQTGIDDPTQLRAPFKELIGTRETLVREIGQRRRFQAAYERTFEVSSRGMARISPYDNTFLHVNARLLDLLGMSKEAVLDKSLGAIMRPEDIGRLEAFRDAMKTDQECSFEAQFTTPDGRHRWLGVTAVLIRDEAGAPDHALALFDDVEQDRKVRRDLEQLRRDISHVGRVNAMGEFAAGLAHELNQPLAAIVHDIDTACMILADDEPDHKELSLVLTDIDNHTHRAGSIILGLRNMVRKDKGLLKPFEVTDLTTQTLTLLSAEARDLNINLSCELPKDATVIGNRTQIAQIIINLVRNSFEALSSTPSGHVSVTVTKQPNTVTIEVADNGPGLPAGTKPFATFESTKDTGLGLGLSICKSLAESNGGSIAYNQKANGGAIFILKLMRGTS